MARGGMRVLCLEKNHFIGGMASTTELVRGYRFELAGSIQFPIPNEIFDDLGFGACPIYEPEVQSASIGDVRPAPDPPLQRSRPAARAPGRVARHRGRAGHGGGRRLGGGPGPGHRSLRRPQAAQVARRDVGVRRQREGARGDPHRHVRQRHGRRRPLPPRPREARPDPQHARASWPSTPPTGARTRRAAPCASPSPSPRRATSPCPRSRAASAPCPTTCWALFEHHGGELRRHVKVARIVVSEGRVDGCRPEPTGKS